jgi:hypothetical protein
LVNNNEIELKYFVAESTPRGVVLKWAAEEFDTAGYNLYRRRTDGAATRVGDANENYTGVNQDLIVGTSPYIYVDGGLAEGVYEYMLEDVDVNGKPTRHGPVSVVHNPSLPGTYALYACRPNPASGKAIISFSVPAGHAGRVELIVYDITGRKALDMSRSGVEPGFYDIEVDTSALAPGVYVYSMTAEGFSAVKKMVVAR